MSDDLDFYDLLGVSEDASEEEIQKGFRTQVRKYHPDLNDDPRAPAQFTALKKAYDTLRDRKERDAYDRMGHHEYVQKRISGLPSPEDWNVPERDEGETPDRDSPDGTGGTTIGGPEERGGTTGSGTATTARSSAGSEGGSSGRSRDGATDVAGGSTSGGNAGASRTSTTTSTTSQSRSGGGTRESSGASLGHQPSVEGGPSRSLDPEAESRTGAAEEDGSQASGSISAGGTRAGAGTARGPDSVWTGSDDDESDDVEGSTGPDDADAAAEEATPVTERLRSGVDALVSATIGWPLIVAADAMFAATLGLYAAENAAGLERFADAIGAAGADTGALQAALSTRPEGMDPFADFLVAQLATEPLLGTVALVGLAFLPSVYFFMVRWTRKNRLPWQPSYLYVVGALAPTLGLMLSASGVLSAMYVEVFLLGVVPLLTIFAMLFFGQIKPRFERTVRRWRYRRKG